MQPLTDAGSGRRWARGGRTVPVLVPVILIAWLAGVYLLVRVTGGTPNPMVHLAYVGIAVAAMTGGWRPGLAMGAAAGILMGPLMPDFTADGGTLVGQWGWLLRFLAYVMAGAVIGSFWERSMRITGELRATEERHRAHGLVEASEHRLHQLVETSPLGIILFDGDSSITTVNPAAATLLGVSPDDVVGSNGHLEHPVELPEGGTAGHLTDLARLALRSGMNLPRLDLVVDRADGATGLLAVVAAPVLDQNGATIGASVTLHDVTASRAVERRRTTRIEEIHRVAALASKEPTAVAAGERLLAELARIAPTISSVIYVFDDDGAECLAEWSEADLDVAHVARIIDAAADRLRELVVDPMPARVALEPILTDRESIGRMHAAGGRSTLVLPLRDDAVLVGILVAADRRAAAPLDAIEEASLADFARICASVVRRAQRDEQSELGRIRQQVNQVLAQPSLVVPLFQPIISLTDGEICGYEALTRFRLQPVEIPEVWFSRAARVGLSAELQALAITRAIDVAKDAGLTEDVFLAINVSPSLVAHPSIIRAIKGLPLRQIVLELTEDEAVSDYATVRRDLAPFRRAGARVAIDDAGAGYASFRHITELEPDFIKLDAQLIDRLTDDGTRQALVRALATFAGEIGAVLVAEGIERPEDLTLLGRLGRRILGQGYAIARPAMPWPDVAPDALQAIRDSYHDDRPTDTPGTRDVDHPTPIPSRLAGRTHASSR